MTKRALELNTDPTKLPATRRLFPRLHRRDAGRMMADSFTRSIFLKIRILEKTSSLAL
jgi:hypothetical protein